MNRHVVLRPHPPGHQIKARCCTLWRQPAPGRQHPRWRCPSIRRKNEVCLGGNRLAPPGCGCRRGPSAPGRVPRNPARTARPSHVPMMPLARCRRCVSRRSRAGPPPVKPLLTCRLTAQRLPSCVVDRRPRTAWRRPGLIPPPPLFRRRPDRGGRPQGHAPARVTGAGPGWARGVACRVTGHANIDCERGAWTSSKWCSSGGWFGRFAGATGPRGGRAHPGQRQPGTLGRLHPGLCGLSAGGGRRAGPLLADGHYCRPPASP